MVRDSIRQTIRFMKETLPFASETHICMILRRSWVTRGGRRLIGEHVVTYLDIACQKRYDDVIAWHSVLPYVTDGAPIEIPYRCILPKNVDNLLCPGRHLSADDRAINLLYLIPQCVGTGQAAGVAAAVALKDGTTTHNVDIKRVQYILSHEQDVPLPRQDNTDANSWRSWRPASMAQ